MNLYQLALKINPGDLKDAENKVIWKSQKQFVYLRREGNYVFMRLSGSEVQAVMYYWDGAAWVTVSKDYYYEVVELWQDEKSDRK